MISWIRGMWLHTHLEEYRKAMRAIGENEVASWSDHKLVASFTELIAQEAPPGTSARKIRRGVFRLMRTVTWEAERKAQNA